MGQLIKSASFLFFLLAALTASAFATTRYITDAAGTGGAGTIGDPYKWNAGAGYTSAIAASAAGDTVHFNCGSYAVTAQLDINTASGTAGNPITIEGCNATTDGNKGVANKATQTILYGTRDEPTLYDSVGAGNADNGGWGFVFGAGRSYITVQHFRLVRFQYALWAQAYNNHFVTINNIFVQYARTSLWVYGDAACQSTANVYTCANGSHDWAVTNLDGQYLTKRHVRLERGVHDFTFTNCDADAGFVGDGDFGVGFENGTSGAAAAPVYNITYNYCTATGFFASSGTTYDNGDGWTSEAYASNITLNHCFSLDTWDGGFDMKGGPVHILNSGSFRDGNRPIRAWNGPVDITNFIAGYNLADALGDDTNYLQLVQRADGSNAAFWIDGFVTLDRFTTINTQYVYRFDKTGNTTLTFTSGNGVTPTYSTGTGAIVTGTTSGVKAKIAGMTGTATTGTLYIFNGGTFTNGENITATGGFSATASSVGTTAGGGQLTASNGIKAYSSAFTGYSTAVQDDSTGLYSLSESGMVTWQQGVSGTDPLFPNPSHSGWIGCNNDYDSSLYGATKGFQNNVGADTCGFSNGQQPQICPSLTKWVVGTGKR